MRKLTAIALTVILLCSAALAFAEPAAEAGVIRWEVVGAGIAAGDRAFFGRYEQDADPDNGPEAIEWIVLDVQDGEALLMSRYILESQPYNEKRDVVTWETCTLRAWLNAWFLDAAFTEEEQALILPTALDNTATQDTEWMESRPGSDTLDRVFLLSFYEAEAVFFDGDEARRIAPTAHALDYGVYGSPEFRTVDGKQTGVWWLRSPYADDDFYAGCVYDNGHVNYDEVTDWEAGVCPVIRVSLGEVIY